MGLVPVPHPCLPQEAAHLKALSLVTEPWGPQLLLVHKLAADHRREIAVRPCRGTLPPAPPPVWSVVPQRVTGTWKAMNVPVSRVGGQREAAQPR